MLTEKYIPEVCEHCGQSKTYVLAIDRGTVDIVKAFSVAVRLKGINAIHPTKEMEIPAARYDYRTSMLEGKLTSTQIGNISRAHRHGLLAKVKGHPGNWCLTTKGAEFLKGSKIPRFAVVSKVTGHQIGYWGYEKDDRPWYCTIGEFRPDQEYWEGINYEIRDGHVIKDVEKKEAAQLPL